MPSAIRHVALILSGLMLAGCLEQVDLLYYPDKTDRRTVRTITDVGTLEACERRAVELARSTGDETLEDSMFECGLGATNDTTFGRRYSRRVQPGWPDPAELEALDAENAPSPVEAETVTPSESQNEATRPQQFLQTASPSVQLAAYISYDEARIHQLIAQHQHKNLLEPDRIEVRVARLDNQQTWFRVRMTGFEDASQARAICQALQAQDHDCEVRED